LVWHFGGWYLSACSKYASIGAQIVLYLPVIDSQDCLKVEWQVILAIEKNLGSKALLNLIRILRLIIDWGDSRVVITVLPPAALCLNGKVG